MKSRAMAFPITLAVLAATLSSPAMSHGGQGMGCGYGMMGGGMQPGPGMSGHGMMGGGYGGHGGMMGHGMMGHGMMGGGHGGPGGMMGHHGMMGHGMMGGGMHGLGKGSDRLHGPLTADMASEAESARPES